MNLFSVFSSLVKCKTRMLCMIIKSEKTFKISLKTIKKTCCNHKNCYTISPNTRATILMTFRFLSDENFNGDIIRGLFLSRSDLDLQRVQDVGLQEADDRAILEWAANRERILLTHDRATMPDFAYERIDGGKRMPGLFVVNDRMPTRQAIDELGLIVTGSEPREWEDRVTYLPL